jgi:hypothetical protein
LLLAANHLQETPGLACQAVGDQVRNQIEQRWKPSNSRGMVGALFIRAIEPQLQDTVRLAMQTRLLELNVARSPLI